MSQNSPIYEFGPFRLDARKRLLWREGEMVSLKPKAFDTLLALVEANGQVVKKNELMQRIWPETTVEEGNLTFNISSLRKALGDDPRLHQYIVTIPGEGYQFVAGVRAGFDELEVRERTRVTIEEQEETDERVANSVSAKSSRHLASAQSPLFDTSNEQLALAPSSLTETKRVRHSMFAAAGLLSVLLAIGLIGFWRYREKQAGRADPPIPFQQIEIKRLTNLGNLANAALSPDGKLFVYSIAEKDGRDSLWLGHVEGGEPIQLRPPREIRYLDLTFAPDGSSLYFIESADFSPGSLYKLPVFGGVPERIKENIPDDITFAPDGKRFAFVRGDGTTQQSTLVAADGGNAVEQVIASRPGSLGFVSSNPAWSPDGSMIAVAAVNNESSRERELVVVRVADGSITQLTALAWTAVYAIEWLKDSSGLVIVAKDKDAALAAQLWHISYPAGEAHRIVADLNTYGSVLSLSADNNALLTLQAQGYTNIWVAPANELKQAKQITSGTRNIGSYGLDWAPDGRIVYTAYLDQSQTIWAMEANGGTQKQLLPTGHTNNTVSITGDGRYIVFQSNRSGSLEVWRANADGSDMRQLTAGGNNSQPHVSPEGRQVVYRSARDGIGALWRISIDGGEPVRLTDKAASWPRVSPNGKRIACSFDADDTTRLAIVPIEGGQPIKLFDAPRLANFAYGIRWTPDGKAVTYHDWAKGIWKQSLDGGEPQRLEGLPEEKLFAHGWSRDGKLFAFARGVQIRDIVLIHNLK